MTKNETLEQGLTYILEQLRENEVSKEDLQEAKEIALQIEDEINRRLGE